MRNQQTKTTMKLLMYIIKEQSNLAVETQYK